MFDFKSFLRRYARASTGSQSRGDALARSVLEGIADDLALLGDEEARIALYRALCKRLGSAQPEAPRDCATTACPTLPMSLPRQAVMLTALAGFSAQDAMRILDISPPELSGLIKQGHQDLQRTPSAGVLIIHDEPLTAMELETALADAGHRVLGIARTPQQAVSIAQEKRPQLIFARSILSGHGSGRSGIMTIADILQFLQAAVVVVSIDPGGLLTGERREPAFMLESPFRSEAVAVMANQALYCHRLWNELPIDEIVLRERIEAALFWLVRPGSVYPFSRMPVEVKICDLDATNLHASLDIGACRFVEGSAMGGYLESAIKAHIPSLRSVGVVMREL